MTTGTAFLGAEIFDGASRHRDAALLVDPSGVAGIVPAGEIPQGYARQHLRGGLLAPGFIDLQVNGGGGVLFNHRPDLGAITTICETHRRFGTTALLPTLITADRDVTAAAIDAGAEAARAEVPGFLGLHLEGPHLSVARKGAHDPSLIRAMQPADLEQLRRARQAMANLMVTVAPESVTGQQVTALAAVDIVVSLGHSDSDFASASAMAQAGARAVTHLFNAMSALTHRGPGMVGAALETGALFAGLIADGIHVHPAAITIALRAKQGPGRIFLVTDAMPTIGTDQRSFLLDGRRVTRTKGRLTLDDGTLAGADLDMISAVRFMADTVGVGLDEALRMASLYPAQCLGIDDRRGHLRAGAAADIVHLDEAQVVESVWVGGRVAYRRDEH
ncbi:MAG: N-acetylglucosamine-6-phosphate deacetylase [Alphaproteobacteria bacterium]